MWLGTRYASNRADIGGTYVTLFKTFSNPMDFWVTLLDIPEYKELAEQAIAIFVQMPTSCLCEQEFSNLVLIKKGIQS